MSCSYNCSAHPTEINEDNDITGIGVLIGYIATAGVVVAIILVYYLLSYQPRLDPFRDGHTDSLFAIWSRPNPVDEIMLRGPRKLSQKIFGTSRAGLNIHVRLEESLVKCVLSMSDIQIITGISILISGGTQLKCGLSCYQWQMLVYLAWFSSLTHLSSLTLLRNYLHNRPAERGWRLFFMFVLVVLLIFAFIPTANYRWQYGYGWDETGVPTVADYAICYLKPVFRPNPPSQFFIDASLSEQSIMAMSISILLLFIGFICRVFKLHQSFSVFVDESIRGRLSHFLRMLLRAVYDWCDIRGSPRSLKRTLLYRPLLAVFLTLRVVLDTWNSMFFEVWWLLVSFTWGVERLFNTLELVPSRQNRQWSFGQVMSITLLAIPIVTLVELLYPESKDRKKGDRNSFLLSPNDEDTQELSELPAPIADDVQRRSSVSHHEIDDHPDFELYYASGSLTVPVVILTLSTMGISLMMLVLASAGGMQMTGLLQISFNPWGIIPLLILFSVYSSILFSFLVTRIGSKAGALRRGKRHLARALHTLVVMFFLTFPLFLYVASSFVWYSVCVVIGFYILCSLFYLCAR